MGNEQNYNEILGKRLSECRTKYRKNKNLPPNEIDKKENKLSQQELADMVGYSSFQSISNIEKGRQPIKKDMAKQFARIFGIDENFFLDVNTEYPTQIDKFNAVLDKTSHENYLMFNAICSLAALNGYNVEIKDIAAEITKTIATGGTFADCYKDYMVFSRNGKKEFSLSLEDANHFGNHINDVFLSHIKWNIKTE